MQVTREGLVPYYPRWSPDGDRIYLRWVQLVDGEYRSMMAYVPAEGGEPVELTPMFERRVTPKVPGGGFNVSPDGEWIAFIDWHEESEDEGFRAIFLVPAEGGEIRQLSVEADSVAQGAIAFSPDGRRVAFFSREQIGTQCEGSHDGKPP